MTLPKKKIEIVPYDPNWPLQYEKEALLIRQALQENLLSLHHFGSTSIPGLPAKPKIDILAEVKNLQSINISALMQIGYENRGEVIPSGRYFSKKNPKVHLHIFEEGNPLIEKNLCFRNWLRSHKEDKDAYANLKKELAQIYTDGTKYAEAKTEFIEKIVQKALSLKEKP